VPVGFPLGGHLAGLAFSELAHIHPGVRYANRMTRGALIATFGSAHRALPVTATLLISMALPYGARDAAGKIHRS